MRSTMNRGGSRRVVVAVAAALLVLGALVAYRLAGREDAGGAGAGGAVAVDPARNGPAVPRSFLGLSMEWDSVLPYTGPREARHAGLLALLEPIRRAAGAPLRLRVGGDTADQAWWNPLERPRPPGVLQDVGHAT